MYDQNFFLGGGGRGGGWWGATVMMEVKLFVGGKGIVAVTTTVPLCPPSAHRILTVNDLTNARASY